MNNSGNFQSEITSQNSIIKNLRGKSLTTREAAAFLGASRRTLEAWRRCGRGPAFIRQGRSVRYRLEDLAAFQEQNRVEPEKP